MNLSFPEQEAENHKQRMVVVSNEMGRKNPQNSRRNVKTIKGTMLAQRHFIKQETSKKEFTSPSRQPRDEQENERRDANNVKSERKRRDANKPMRDEEPRIHPLPLVHRTWHLASLTSPIHTAAVIFKRTQVLLPI